MEEDRIDYKIWIGRKVVKKSGRPFKSTFKTNTVKNVTINPQSPKSELAFEFEEDKSIVNCQQCVLRED